MCSKRCAKPVRPGFSFFEPTWYHWLTWTIGSLRSTCRMTCEPVGQRVLLELDLRGRPKARAAAAGAGASGRRRPRRAQGPSRVAGRGPRTCADSRFSSSSRRRRSSTLAGRTWIRTGRSRGFGRPGGLGERLLERLAALGEGFQESGRQRSADRDTVASRCRSGIADHRDELGGLVLDGQPPHREHAAQSVLEKVAVLGVRRDRPVAANSTPSPWTVASSATTETDFIAREQGAGGLVAVAGVVAARRREPREVDEGPGRGVAVDPRRGARRDPAPTSVRRRRRFPARERRDAPWLRSRRR